jgi:hypothetical protein
MAEATGQDEAVHTKAPQPGDGRPRLLVAGVAAVLVVILLAVVVVATQAHYAQKLLPTSSSGGALGGSAGAAVGQTVVTALLILAELGVVAILVFFPWRRARELGKRGEPLPALSRRTRLQLAGMAFGMLLALVVLVALGLKRRKTPFRAAATGPGGQKLPSHLVTPSGLVQLGPTLVVSSLVVTLVVVVVAAAIYVMTRRHGLWRGSPPPEPAQSELPEELAGALDGSLEILSAGVDPRSAVIVAYARMEGVLAERGLSRRHFETPLEYLDRAMGGLRVSHRALAKLTALFESARFSPHPVDFEMRNEAEHALASLRDELRSTT